MTERLSDQLAARGEVRLAVLENEQEFWSLIWLKQAGSRVLTPDNAGHNLESVVQRAIDFPWDDLDKPKGLSHTEHNPGWFKKVIEFAQRGVDLRLMETVALTPSTIGGSDLTKLSIYEGQHRMLALAKTLRNGCPVCPFRVLLLLPGRKF